MRRDLLRGRFVLVEYTVPHGPRDVRLVLLSDEPNRKLVLDAEVLAKHSGWSADGTHSPHDDSGQPRHGRATVILYLPGLTQFSNRKAVQITWAFRHRHPRLVTPNGEWCSIIGLPSVVDCRDEQEAIRSAIRTETPV